MGKGGLIIPGALNLKSCQALPNFSEGLRFNYPPVKPTGSTLKVNLYILVTFLQLGFVNPCGYYLTLWAHDEPNILHKI